MTFDKSQEGLFDHTETDAYPNTDTDTDTETDTDDSDMTETVYQVHCNKCGELGVREDQLDAIYLRDSHDCLEISIRIEEVSK